MNRPLTGIAIVTVISIIAFSVLIIFFVSTPCLLLRNGDSGKLIAAFPVEDGIEFSITFIHSVNNSPVTDMYKIQNGKIYVVKTIYYSFGAGVQTEIEESQSLEYGEDGSMIVSGFDLNMDNLSYIVGTVSDHILKINENTISLRELCGRNTIVKFSIGLRLKYNKL
jgi:hypothetical protein